MSDPVPSPSMNGTIGRSGTWSRPSRKAMGSPPEGAMEDLFAVITPVRRKFTVSVEINSEELPPPYDEAPAVAHKAALLDEEESEDEDESEDEETAERDLDF